jgi:hypothetical protein
MARGSNLSKHIANAASEKTSCASFTILFFLLRKISGNGQIIICFRSAKNLNRKKNEQYRDNNVRPYRRFKYGMHNNVAGVEQ